MAARVYKLVKRRSSSEWHGGDIGYVAVPDGEETIGLYATEDIARASLDSILEKRRQEQLENARKNIDLFIERARKKYDIVEEVIEE